MIFQYAIYVYIASILTVGDVPLKVRVDNIESLKWAQKLNEDPQYYIKDGDLYYMYTYGECYKGREPTEADLNMLAYVLGGDCSDCVCRDTD